MGLGAAAAGIGAIGAIGGGLIASSGQRSAAKTEANAATNASDEQLQAAQLAANAQITASQTAANTQMNMFDQTQSTLAPWVTGGNSAMSQLSALMGIGGTNTSGAPTISQIMSPLYQLFGIGQPNGAPAQSQLNAVSNMPGYQFSLQQGTQALDRSAAAQGLLLSGGQQKAVTQYGQGLASTQLQNYLNEYQSNIVNPYAANVISPLQTASSLGENAAALTGNAGTSAASGAANSILTGATGAANSLTSGTNSAVQSQLAAALAQASGQMGQANTATSTLSSALNAGLYGYSSYGGLNSSINSSDNYAMDTVNGDLSGLYGNPANYATLGNQDPSILQGLASDRRVKKDIKRVGKTDDGLPIYTFRYKTGGPVRMGVMADEVQKKRPDAVRTIGRAGLKTVDYGKISPLEQARKAA